MVWTSKNHKKKEWKFLNACYKARLKVATLYISNQSKTIDIWDQFGN